MVNIGILGTASIAKRSLIPAIKELPTYFNLIGVASRDKNNASRIAKALKKETFVGYESILHYPKLDALYIPLPNSLHYKWVNEALDRDINILVEKSLACSLREVLFLNKKAKSKNLVLIENFQFRFHKQLQVIQDLVNSGEIGELRSLHISFGFPPFEDANNIRYSEELGGGALLDAGAYTLKIAQIFLGPYVDVLGASSFICQKNNIDLYGGGFLKERIGSKFANISFGFDNHYQCRIELWGSLGKIIADRIFTAPPDLEVRICLEKKESTKHISIPKCNHFKEMLTYFHQLIESRKNLNFEYEQNINQARLLEDFKKLTKI